MSDTSPSWLVPETATLNEDALFNAYGIIRNRIDQDTVRALERMTSGKAERDES